MKLILMSFLICISSLASAASLNNVTLPDQVTIAGQPDAKGKVVDKVLALNGLGLRTVVKFGFTVKVYVAGLYLENKSSDTDQILNDKGLKRIVMHFVRPVDREAIVETFKTSYENTCVKNCDKKGEQFKKLGEQVVSVRKDNEITMTFYPDKVEFEVTGPNAKKQMLMDADLAYNMLSVFIHKEKSPGKEFRAGILGLATPAK